MNEVPQQKRGLKPSPSARLERWARLLRTSKKVAEEQADEGDDSQELASLKSRIYRRMAGEHCRGGEFGGVADAIGAAFGMDSIEHRAACREAQNLRESVEAWGNLFAQDWGRPYVSLSGAVHWIATDEQPNLCAVCRDADLEEAARNLLTAACDEKITVFGVKNEDDSPEEISSQCFVADSPFAGDVPDYILRSKVPVVRWMLDLEEDWRTGDGDTIETRSKVLWRRLSVKKANLQALWPAGQRDFVELQKLDGPASWPLPIEIDAFISEGSQDEQSIQRRKPTIPVVIAAWLLSHFPVRTAHSYDDIAKLIRNDARDIPLFSPRTLTSAQAIAYSGKEEFAELRKTAQDYANIRKFK